MEYGTRTENILDTYKNGGAWRILNLQQVKEIKELFNKGTKSSDIAKTYGVSQSCISAIKKGRSYAWLKEEC